MTINIDFDGTCVTHDFPNVGKSIGAEKVLKRLTDNGHQLILFTMRGDRVRKRKTQQERTPVVRKRVSKRFIPKNLHGIFTTVKSKSSKKSK